MSSSPDPVMFYEIFEWFEILELRTKKRVYVNPLSGKCQWNQPDKYQKLTDNQWWELFDFKSNHFYYYNSQTNVKTWVKPSTTNFVSLVKLQVIKERKKKTFIDGITQTNSENLHVNAGDTKIEKTFNRIDISSENIETSGCSTYKSDNGHINISKDIPIDLDAHRETFSILPVNRRPVPRTNPKFTHPSSNYRLSQPIMSLYCEKTIDDINFEEPTSPEPFNNRSSSNLLGHCGFTSLVSIDKIPDFELTRSGNKVPPNFVGNFPRHSVMNSIERQLSGNNEIWLSSLFTKSGSQMAGIKTWTAKSIPDTLLAATPKAYKKKALDNFKQIQMYMGDRETVINKEQLALAICRRGISSTAWSNEIFMQICKQVTHNPKMERTFNGWDLICICLMFFHPESIEMRTSFKSFLEQYSCADRKLDRHMLEGQDYNAKSIFCARISLKLLEMSRKVTEITLEDVCEARKSYASSTIFYSSLNEVMDVQGRLYTNRKLPWIQVALTKEILRCGGAQTQGILRIPSEIFKIETLCEAIEKSFKSDSVIDISTLSNSNGCDPLLNKILEDLNYEHDALLLSSVLKYWLRHLRDPILNFGELDESLTLVSRDFGKILQKIETIPKINCLVLKYLIYFLQVLARPENVMHTNMPVENLVTLMAPTLFKLDFNQLQPAMCLLQNLIVNLDTADVAHIC